MGLFAISQDLGCPFVTRRIAALYMFLRVNVFFPINGAPHLIHLDALKCRRNDLLPESCVVHCGIYEKLEKSIFLKVLRSPRIQEEISLNEGYCLLFCDNNYKRDTK